MREIHVTRDQVSGLIAATFPEYTGLKLQVRPVEAVQFQNLAWEGGTRCEYRSCAIDGTPAGSMSRPGAEGKSVELPPQGVIVEHCIFQGKDLGLRFYIRPDDMPPMLAGPVELTRLERLVLLYTRGRKASYNGKNRYEMAKEDAEWGIAEAGQLGYKSGEVFPSPLAWATARDALVNRGFLTKANAITRSGRNAIS